MKRLRLGVLLLGSCILMCSCTKQSEEVSKKVEKKTEKEDTDTGKKDFKTVFAEAEEQIPEVKQMADDHMKFQDDFYLNVPKPEEVQKVCSFVMTYEDNWSGEKTYEAFKELYHKYFPNVYSKQEEKDLCTVNMHHVEKKDEDGNALFTSGKYEEYEEAIAKGEEIVDCIYFGNRKGSLEVYPGKFFQMSRGVGARLDKNKTPIIYTPCSYHPIEKYIPVTYPYQGEESYPLMDQKITIKDATKTVIRFLEDCYEGEYALKPVVNSVRVVNMEQGFYAYNFSVTQQYHGIRFDSDPMKYGQFMVQASTGPNEEDYQTMPAEVQMIQSNDIDSVTGYGENQILKEEETYDKIIGFKEAMEIMKKKISSEMDLQISNVDFIYSVYAPKDNDKEQHGTPEWKISARNTTDHLDYYFYVNAADGSFHYYYDEPPTQEK